MGAFGCSGTYYSYQLLSESFNIHNPLTSIFGYVLQKLFSTSYIVTSFWCTCFGYFRGNLSRFVPLLSGCRGCVIGLIGVSTAGFSAVVIG